MIKFIFLWLCCIGYAKAQTTLYARGSGFNDYSKSTVVKLDGEVIIEHHGRGLCLTIIDANSLQHLSSTTYDTYSSILQSDNLAMALNSLGRDKIGVITSRDAWENNVSSNLIAAAKRLGLFKLAARSGYRNPYAAIFKGANQNFKNSMVLEVLQPSPAGSNFASIATFIIEDSFISNDIGSVLLKTDGNANEPGLSLNHYGNVGIGIDNPDEKLTVKGNIHSQEVRVDLAGVIAPDYVFEKNYNLMPVDEVEKFINTEGHLPKIPSAEELERDGLNLKEMNLNLLEKIEELTLYIIEQNNEIKSLKESNANLNKRLLVIEN